MATDERTSRTSRIQRPERLRFRLPQCGTFDQVSIELEPRAGLFSLSCLRRNGKRGTASAVPRLNRFRLRELEATLVELSLTLPAALRSYFIAVLMGDSQEQLALSPQVSPFVLERESQTDPIAAPRAAAG
jgi:hypothetical protein